MKNGLSIIIRNEEQFEKASKFIGKEYCYIKWVPQMAERETALVVWAKKKVNRSTGSVGCAENQRQDKLERLNLTISFSKMAYNVRRLYDGWEKYTLTFD